MRFVIRCLVIFFGLYLIPIGTMVLVNKSAHAGKSWWQLSRDSSEQAPDASMTDDAIIQVYAARAARWRGAFGVHTWYATKRSDEDHYTRLEVIGYSVYWGHDAVRVRSGTPDAYWYGNRPTLLREIRGTQQVDQLIDRLHTAAETYPFNNEYRVWPGPNSNTFTAYLARQVPELRLDLPANAIGKDYLPAHHMFARSPSGLGGQMSLGGYAGVMLSLEEGLEINLAGLSAGIDLYPPALKLPGVGRIGFADTPQVQLP